jgi:hypothetical protein
MRAEAEGHIGITAAQINVGTTRAEVRSTHDFFSNTSIDGASVGRYSFAQPKTFKFDPEQITNTVTMLRAFQAVLDKFSFSESEIEKLGITDLVSEDTTSRTRTWPRDWSQ